VEWRFGNETIMEGGQFEFRTPGMGLGFSEEELLIREVTVENRGEYSCIAANSRGMGSYTYFLEVQEGVNIPFFRQQPLSEASVVAGETVVIHCEAVGGPNLVLSWFRTPLESDTPITELFPSERVVISPRELVIFDLRPEEEGFYFCMAKNELGEITSHFGQLNVWTPPEFDPGLIVNYLVAEGASPSLVLPCSGTGDPQPDLHWLRGSTVLPTGINEMRILPDGSLEIFRPGPQDEGDYDCRLANAAGEKFLRFNVRVRAIPRVQIDPSDPPTLDVGAQLSLFCSDMRTQPEELEELKWRRNGEPLVTGGNIVVFPETGELVISDMQISDSGNYTCEICSYAGSDNETVVVIVEDPLLASGVMTTPLSVSSPTPFTQTLSEGQTAQFVCVTSRPPPDSEIMVEWLKDGEPLRNLRRITVGEIEVGSQLTITDVRITDEATYSCIASNRIGEVESIDFNLAISTRPIITWAPVSRDIIAGENITLSCKAVGTPDPEITWLFNGEQITGCLFESPNTISVCNTTVASSRGWYSCVARNIAGTTEYSIYVNVTSSSTVAPNITSRSQSMIVNAGNSLILDCLATGNPLPVITWLKDGERLVSNCESPSGGACVELGMDGSVYIRDTQLSDTGTYTCLATNTAGQAVYEVHVLVAPSAELPRFAVFPRIVNQSAELFSVECQTTSDPPAHLCWLTGDNTVVSKNSSDRIYSIGGTLYIVNPVAEDSGQYICRANNSAGINQVSITLRLGEDTSGDGSIRDTSNDADESQEPKFLEAPGDVVTYEGLPVTVPCSTTKSLDSFTVWRKGKRPLLQDDDITVTTNGSLVIERSKVDHSGEYDCVAVSEDGVLRATISIDIQSRSGPPDLLTSPRDIRVPVGSGFVLPCQPDGVREVTTLSWLLNGNPLQSECGVREVREDGSLHVAGATNTSAGVYTCRVRNKYTMIDATTTVTVTDYLINTTLTVVEGEALYELPCGVPDSAHSTGVQWTQGTRPLPFSPFIVPFGARLLFITVQSGHQGEYTCTYNGSTFSVFLNVLMVPTVINQTPSLSVSRYDPVALDCQTTGNPKPLVVWFLNGESVDGRSVQATPLATGSLYLHPPLPPGDTVATCEASNHLGVVRSTTIITAS
jgi:hemicentin